MPPEERLGASHDLPPAKRGFALPLAADRTAQRRLQIDALLGRPPFEPPAYVIHTVVGRQHLGQPAHQRVGVTTTLADRAVALPRLEKTAGRRGYGMLVADADDRELRPAGIKGVTLGARRADDQLVVVHRARIPARGPRHRERDDERPGARSRAQTPDDGDVLAASLENHPRQLHRGP